MCNLEDNGPGYSDIESESESFFEIFLGPDLSARHVKPAAAVHVALPDVARTAAAVGKWAEHKNQRSAHLVSG